MSAINDLISQIQDESLRDRIQSEVNKMSKQKKFGLVFEEHLPECTSLYDVPVKRGSLVVLKCGDINNKYIVGSIVNGIAKCMNKVTEEVEEIPLENLVTVAEFGKPIYPYLKSIDSICNAPDSDLWHTLIEADNYLLCSFLNISMPARWTAFTSIRLITPEPRIGSTTMTMWTAMTSIATANGFP